LIRAALLAAAFMAAQAGALRLTQSGDWGLGWVPLGETVQSLTMTASFAALGTAMVVWTTGRTPAWRSWLRVSGWRAAAAIGVLTVAGTALRPWLREYAAGLALTAAFTSLGVLLLVAAAMATPPDAATQWSRRLARWRDTLPWSAAAWTFVVSAALSWFVFERVPHVPDEVAYWFQAKYFAAGHLYLAPPPDPAAFELPHTIVDGGKWYSIFPPGWPAVLAIGMWLRAPWLINPALGAVAVVLLHALAVRLYSRRTADISATLLAASPMFLLMSAGLMSHPLSLVLALVALLGWCRGVEDASAPRTVAGAVALGGLMLTRPFEGAIFALVLAAWGVSGLVRQRDRLVRFASFLVVAMAIGSTTLLYNRALTGRPTYDPITKYFDERYYPGVNRLGFGRDVGNTGWRNDLQPGHSPLEAALNGNRNGYLLNLELFGWSFGSLAAVVALLIWGRVGGADLFVGSIAVAIVLGLSLYWYGGTDFGPRYWYQVVSPLALLTARGLQSMAEWPWPGVTREVIAGRFSVAVGVATVAALLVFLPWRAATKYYHYRGMGGAVAAIARTGSFANALVFVAGAADGAPFSRYSNAAVFNPPVLDKPGPIFARDLGADSRRRIACAFSGRIVRRLDTSALPAGALVVDEVRESPAAPACAAAVAVRKETR
jgi:hypothetical protein